MGQITSSHVTKFIERVKAQHGIDLNEMDLDIYFDINEGKVLIDITEDEFFDVLNKHLTSYAHLIYDHDRAKVERILHVR